MYLRGIIIKWPIVVAGLSLAFLLLLLKWLEAQFLVFNYALELYIGSLAAIFTLLGIWLSNKFFRKEKTIVVEREIFVPAHENFVRNESEIQKIGLSPRELEVLQLISAGLSNQEIADKLFVSVNTVKTHGSNLLSKMEVKRRTQAVDLGKKLGIIK